MISVSSLNSHVLSLIFLINDFDENQWGYLRIVTFFLAWYAWKQFPRWRVVQKIETIIFFDNYFPILDTSLRTSIVLFNIFFFFIKYRAQESTFFIFHFSNIEIDNDYLLFHIYVVPSRFSRLENSARWYFARVCMHRKKRPRASRIANSNITPSSPSLSLRPK